MKKFIDIEAMRNINWKEAYLEEAKACYNAKYIFLIIALMSLFI